MKKITVIETDNHGNGVYSFDNISDTYSYDDGLAGDLSMTLRFLVDIGFIPKESVEIYTVEEAVKKLNKE